MSRTGTLVDALENVEQFRRAPLPHKGKSVKNKSRSNCDPSSSEDETRSKKERRRKREKERHLEKLQEKKKIRRREKNKKKLRRREERKDETDSSDGSSEPDHKHSTTKDPRRDQKGRKDSRREKRKESEGKRKADFEESSSNSESDEGASPDVVADEITSKFPDDAKDLKQLLEMIDSGQAVDISGLPNKGLVTLLRKLFLALALSSAQRDIFLLPKGAQPTLELMASFFKRTASSHAISRTAERELQVPSTPDVEPALVETKRRVIGPAMPSAETLAAAARLTEAEFLLREAERELENDPMVGPPPPSVVAEVASANDAERFEEVTRMLARDVGNAYDVLGVKPDLDPSLLKKKYWKLSLLVHPDKCSHPQAHEAFMALNKAFKDLQDPTKKAEIDRKVAERQAREEFEEEMKAKREAAQWRRLRGEAEEGDDELLRATPEEPVRDEWMTKLPPERQAGGPPVQQNTFFSKSEKSGRGDTSIWTDTPAAKAEKAKMQYLEAYKQAALTMGPADEIDVHEKERAAKEAQLMDTYNSHKRSQSLMDQHKLDRSQAGKKKKEKSAKPVKTGLRKPSENEDDWKQNHPWKPWDREKDLTAGRQSVNLDPKKFTEGLANRFGTTQNEPRQFL